MKECGKVFWSMGEVRESVRRGVRKCEGGKREMWGDLWGVGKC